MTTNEANAFLANSALSDPPECSGLSIVDSANRDRCVDSCEHERQVDEQADPGNRGQVVLLERAN